MEHTEDADARLWSAVVDPTRRELLNLLLHEGPASASALAERMPVTRQAIAKHLSVLRAAGLVEGLPAGRELRFEINAERMRAAGSALSRVAADWELRLQRIKQLAEHAEATRPRPLKSRK